MTFSLKLILSVLLNTSVDYLFYLACKIFKLLYEAPTKKKEKKKRLLYEANADIVITFEGTIPLPWSNRIKIALGAAKGLAFLHGGPEPVIYRDFKTSNILLDSVCGD